MKMAWSGQIWVYLRYKTHRTCWWVRESEAYQIFGPQLSNWGTFSKMGKSEEDILIRALGGIRAENRDLGVQVHWWYFPSRRTGKDNLEKIELEKIKGSWTFHFLETRRILITQSGGFGSGEHCSQTALYTSLYL
jgi:hypothetical protein